MSVNVLDALSILLILMTVWATEGGIRCPSIIAYPALGEAASGVIRHEMTTVMDLLPTIVSHAAQAE